MSVRQQMQKRWIEDYASLPIPPSLQNWLFCLHLLEMLTPFIPVGNDGEACWDSDEYEYDYDDYDEHVSYRDCVDSDYYCSD